MTLVQAHQRREDAAALGVMLLIASESLLFAGLFALYAAYRLHYPHAFALGVRQDLRWLGSLNTAVLLTSSTALAAALGSLARGRSRCAQGLLLLTLLLGLVFLVLKGSEYAVHVHDGILPGGRSAWFQSHREPGLSLFFGLYYLMTALHALHLLAGAVWIAVLLPAVGRGADALPALERCAWYWHFVDLLWVFLWPVFYLLGNPA